MAASNCFLMFPFLLAILLPASIFLLLHTPTKSLAMPAPSEFSLLLRAKRARAGNGNNNGNNNTNNGNGSNGTKSGTKVDSKWKWGLGGLAAGAVLGWLGGVQAEQQSYGYDGGMGGFGCAGCMGGGAPMMMGAGLPYYHQPIYQPPIFF